MPQVSEQLPPQQTRGDLRESIAARLGKVRERTFELIEPLSEDVLNGIHDPLMSPIVWDLGHMAAFEDLWLAQQAFGRPPLRDGLGKIYDPNAAPRAERGALPYLRSEDCRAYMGAVRERALECLSGADLSADADLLLADGFVYELILRHEMQHLETILQTLQIMTSESYEPDGQPQASGAAAVSADMIPIAGGEFEQGTDRLVFSYDNERPAHRVQLNDFLIDRTPVTNGAFIEFIEADGYRRPELWSADGRGWLEESGQSLPRYWRRDADGYSVRSFASWSGVDPLRPICHVSWYEADAFARFAGKRLPSESEWERGARGPNGDQQRYPWGDRLPDERLANLGQLAFGTRPAGSHPDGATGEGVLGMIGDVWEWTSSGFSGYPGFAPYPYPEYSQDFFEGPYRVLRGGAWATSVEAVTNTFRNWDYPQRSQIFAGFRCARDAEPGTED